MPTTTDITSLIAALRAETEKNSVSPENVGYLIQLVYDYAGSLFSSVSENVRVLSVALSALEGRALGHETNIQTLRNSLSSLDAAVSGLSAEINAVTGNVKTVAGKTELLEERVTALEEDNWVIL
ncbi:MAG: hypothetical protein IJ328_03330 [Muribaculaceae bacterium]|nr:hypothetical protein [Muribaculaceae bacterium]